MLAALKILDNYMVQSLLQSVHLNLCFYIKEKDVPESFDDCVPRVFLAGICNYFKISQSSQQP